MKEEKRIEKGNQRVNQVAKIQVDRQLQAQELGWLFRPLAFVHSLPSRLKPGPL